MTFSWGSSKMVSHSFIRDHFHHMGWDAAKFCASSTTLTHDRVSSIRKQTSGVHTRRKSNMGRRHYLQGYHFIQVHRADPTAAGHVGVRVHWIRWSCWGLWIFKWSRDAVCCSLNERLESDRVWSRDQLDCTQSRYTYQRLVKRPHGVMLAFR